jgi:uncharacterized LabA/DUF88 family protein
MSDRVLYLVDGFNLYRSIRAAMDALGVTQGLRWLDLPAFCGSTLGMFGEQRVHLERVVYFSAPARHMDVRKPGHTGRQQAYLDALEASGVEVVLSRFKKKMPLCVHCGLRTRQYEEKETDVALAVRLLEAFARDECDAVALVTGDTDVLPAVRAVRRMYPERTVAVVCPYLRHSRELLAASNHGFLVGEAHYARFQFPDVVASPRGRLIARPAAW